MSNGGRIRAIAMIAVFDIAGPLITYSLLRRSGLGTVSALILSGLFPALGIALTAIQFRRVDVVGATVLAGIVLGTLLGLTTRNPRLVLMEGAVPGAVFAAACLGSLVRGRRPLIYHFALEFIGPGTDKGREFAALWQYDAFRRAFAVITAVWGIGYLVEVGVRIVVVEATSTGVALTISKTMPYAFAGLLTAWTLGYGTLQRKKNEQPAQVHSTGAPQPDPDPHQ